MTNFVFSITYDDAYFHKDFKMSFYDMKRKLSYKFKREFE